MHQLLDHYDTAHSAPQPFASFPDLDEPYNPFGFDDYGFIPPPQPAPLLRINTTFSRSCSSGSSSAASSPPPLTATAYSSTTSPSSLAPSPSPSPFNDTNLPTIHNANDHIHQHFARTNNTCLPPALLTLPTQIIPHHHTYASSPSPPYIARRVSSGPGLPVHVYPPTQLTEPEAYILPPSISRRHSSFGGGLHSSLSIPSSINTSAPPIPPQHPLTSPRVESLSSGGVGPHRHTRTLIPSPKRANASPDVSVSVGAHRAVLVSASGHRAQTGRPPVLGGRRRKDGRVKAFKCPVSFCSCF